MNSDEKAIREVVQRWMDATREGDAEAVLDLVADDAVFTVAGREPFGKAAFIEAAKGAEGVSIDGKSEIVELQLIGDWAFTRNRMSVVMTMPGAEPVTRSGYTLTIFRKDADGKWRLARDANLLTPD